jgi:hypothetical protein
VDPYLRRILTRLGDADPIEVLGSTPSRLSELVERLGADGLERSHGPDKWPAKVVVAHLADTELGMGFRFRQALAVPPGDPPHAVQPFDQDAWAARSGRLDVALSLEAFRALRSVHLALFATLSLDDWTTEVFHPERGFESFDQMVRFLAGHDLNHLDQLAVVAGVR